MDHKVEKKSTLEVVAIVLTTAILATILAAVVAPTPAHAVARVKSHSNQNNNRTEAVTPKKAATPTK